MDMTTKQAVMWLKGYVQTTDSPMTSVRVKPELNVELNELEPCEDAISREAVKDKVKELFSMGECYCDEHSIIGMINELPPVTQKSGKWIDREEYDADRWKCSVCGRTEPYKENYCPNCGAKMESEVNNG